jgi:hypothetical protein
MAEEALATPASPRREGIRAGRRVARSRRVDRASRHAGNRELVGLVSELRCECGRPNCRATVPAVAETQRGTAERLVVTPAHFEAGVVVRAADRFFVVEPGGYTLGTSRSGVR